MCLDQHLPGLWPNRGQVYMASRWLAPSSLRSCSLPPQPLTLAHSEQVQHGAGAEVL